MFILKPVLELVLIIRFGTVPLLTGRMQLTPLPPRKVAPVKQPYVPLTIGPHIVLLRQLPPTF